MAYYLATYKPDSPLILEPSSVVLFNDGDKWTDDSDIEYSEKELSDIRPVPKKWCNCSECFPIEGKHVCLKIYNPDRWDANVRGEFEYASAVWRNNGFFFYDQDQELFGFPPPKNFEIFWAPWD